MKNRIGLIIMLLLILSPTIYAQSTELIGDTIELSVNGYKEGQIQWQISNDSVKWTDLVGAIKPVTKAKINQNCYYRAKISKEKCIYYSSCTFIKACFYKIRNLNFTHSNDTVRFTWLDPVSDDFKGISISNKYDNSQVFVPKGQMSFKYKYDSNIDSILFNFKPVYVTTNIINDTTIKINNYELFFSVNNRFVAHRGYSSLYPENTILAYEKAAQIGFKYVECDIQLTKDQKWVLLHDETIDRVSNGTGAIANLNYNDILNLNFGEPLKYNNKFNVPISSYEYFLKTCVRLNLYPHIEIKMEINDNQALNLINLTLKNIPIYQFSFHSFSLNSLRAIRKLNKRITIGLTRSDFYKTDIDLIKELKPAYYFPQYTNFLINNQFSKEKIDEMKEIYVPKGIYIQFWTLDDKNLANKFLENGIRNIVTNYPLFKQ